MTKKNSEVITPRTALSLATKTSKKKEEISSKKRELALKEQATRVANATNNLIKFLSTEIKEQAEKGEMGVSQKLDLTDEDRTIASNICTYFTGKGYSADYSNFSMEMGDTEAPCRVTGIEIYISWAPKKEKRQ